MLPQAPQKWTYVLNEPTRILVVDDDPILREFAIVNLSTPTAEVETAADGKAALDLLLTRDFDIVLVDIGMPGLDGFELVERARAHDELRHIPMVMLTGQESIAAIDRAYHAGATSFTTKPVNWRQLSYHLRYVLRASRMQAEELRAPIHTQDSAALKANGLNAIRGEISTSLNSIIDFANWIADDCGRDLSDTNVAYAESIAAISKYLLRILQYGDANSGSTLPCERAAALASSLPAAQVALPQDANSEHSGSATQFSDNGVRYG